MNARRTAEFCHNKGALSSHLSAGHNVGIAEKHAPVVHGHARSPQVRNKVDGAHRRRLLLRIRLHLVTKQQRVIVAGVVGVNVTKGRNKKKRLLRVCSSSVSSIR